MKNYAIILILLVFSGIILFLSPKNAELGKCYQYPKNASWETQKDYYKVAQIEGNYVQLKVLINNKWYPLSGSNYISSGLFSYEVKCPEVK